MVQYHWPKEPYASKKDITVSKAIGLIEANGGFPLVLLNNDNTIYGVVSSGDILRYFASQTAKALSDARASEVANTVPIIGHETDAVQTVDAYFSQGRILCLPILGQNRVVQRILTQQKPYIEIGGRRIKEDSFPFIIAEIGVNHNGSWQEARWLMEQAASAGCDAVKFQHRGLGLYSDDGIDTYDLGTQYIVSEINRTRLSIDELAALEKEATALGLEFIVTPFDRNALEEIVDAEISISALKIASCDLTNIKLIEQCAKQKVPLILSTGMSTEREILGTSSSLRRLMIEHAFLHCNSTYPTPTSDVRLAYIRRLSRLTRTVVGYSSHDGNIVVPLGAVALGAKIVEFHITRNKNLRGTDHRSSLEKEDVARFVRSCKLVSEAIGDELPRSPTQGEIANKQSLGKSLALKRDRKRGEVIEKDDFILVSPGTGFGFEDMEKLSGRKMKRDYRKRTILIAEDIDCNDALSIVDISNTVKGLKEAGYIPGIPVRYHDFERLNSRFVVPLLEFHMSDRDLQIAPSRYLKKRMQEVTLVVHAVEQYEDGFILDLASRDEDILRRSRHEIERLVKHIELLCRWFNRDKKVPIVLNVGGFSKDAFITADDYRERHEIVVDNLLTLQKLYTEVEFLPQTMPPFPWHQGGRSFHNLMTTTERIEDMLRDTGCRICFDVSHSALAACHYNECLYSMAERVSDCVAHVHLSDAQGMNAEGLEIGEGAIDFKRLHASLKIRETTSMMMIPEVWQGHLNGGERFARGLMLFNELIHEA